MKSSASNIIINIAFLFFGISLYWTADRYINQSNDTSQEHTHGVYQYEYDIDTQFQDFESSINTNEFSIQGYPGSMLDQRIRILELKVKRLEGLAHPPG